jgi:hypothetical protein
LNVSNSSARAGCHADAIIVSAQQSISALRDRTTLVDLRGITTIASFG